MAHPSPPQIDPTGDGWERRRTLIGLFVAATFGLMIVLSLPIGQLVQFPLRLPGLLGQALAPGPGALGRLFEGLPGPQAGPPPGPSIPASTRASGSGPFATSLRVPPSLGASGPTAPSGGPPPTPPSPGGPIPGPPSQHGPRGPLAGESNNGRCDAAGHSRRASQRCKRHHRRPPGCHDNGTGLNLDRLGKGHARFSPGHGRNLGHGHGHGRHQYKHSKG